MKREIRITRDGSPTLYLPDLDEHYHSMHGAVQEAKHVFIENGLLTRNEKAELKILEVGFGSGLNALLTCIKGQENPSRSISYIGIESNPLNHEEQKMMDFSEQIKHPNLQEFVEKIHTAEWNVFTNITSNFSLLKIEAEIQKFTTEPNAFDIIYYDAFGPRAQGEMWVKPIFEPLYRLLNDNGILVTYCAQGQFKRNLKEIGFKVESRPGPPGKREMTVAKKIVII
jgi:tRNA U34 5-methylaminomethyl-2-thiouridine-forming methyltransferase MnmC